MLFPFRSVETKLCCLVAFRFWMLFDGPLLNVGWTGKPDTFGCSIGPLMSCHQANSIHNIDQYDIYIYIFIYKSPNIELLSYCNCILF